MGQAHIDSSKAYFYFYPGAAIDFVSQRPMILMGGAFDLSQRWSIGIGAGIKYLNEGAADTTIIRPYGHCVLVELKRRFALSMTRQRLFISLEYKYTADGTNDVVRYFDDRDSVPLESFYDNYGIERRIHGLSLKSGCEVLIGKRFYAEGFFGFGLRWRKFTTTGNEFESNPHARQYWRDHWPTREKRPSEAEELILHISLGVKFGVRL